MKGYWLQSQNGFAAVVHRLYLVFETARRTDGTKLTGRIYHDRDGVGISGGSSTNPSDRGGGLVNGRPGANRVGVTRHTVRPDIDIPIAGSTVVARATAHRDVE